MNGFSKSSMKFKKSELKEFLDEKVGLYNQPSFIESDPISIPHRYTEKGDIEIAGFLAATIAWGNRKMILRSSARMMDILEDSPYEFIVNSSDCELDQAIRFVHRTFNLTDLAYFLQALRQIYRNRGGLETIFETYKTSDSLQPAIHELHKIFFGLPHEKRTERHVSDPFKGSAAKKINMFLRIIKVAVNQSKLVHLDSTRLLNPLFHPHKPQNPQNPSALQSSCHSL